MALETEKMALLALKLADYMEQKLEKLIGRAQIFEECALRFELAFVQSLSQKKHSRQMFYPTLLGAASAQRLSRTRSEWLHSGPSKSRTSW